MAEYHIPKLTDGKLAPGVLPDGTGAGSDGASAYQVAVANGFVGTEVEWLASLEGPAGPAGPQGEPGPVGPAGPEGPAGAGSTVPGPQGDPGPAGADGDDGLSAYQVAVGQGFVGTEAEWLASLVGPEGPEGPAGADGADSTVPGPEGPEGPQGPAGEGVDATGATDGHVWTADGAGSAAWEAPPAVGGGGSTFTVTDTPAAPAEGSAASFWVSSAVTWPAGLVWSTDPDGGTQPTITAPSLVTMLTVSGTTYATLASVFGGGGGGLDDTSNPTWTATLTTGTPTPTTVPITASALAEDNADLTYEITLDSGTSWAVIVPSGLVFTASGLTPGTAYPAPQIRVKDSSDNPGPTLTAQAFTTASEEEITLASAILDLSPAGYWKLDEAAGSTTLTDSSGNGRNATTDGTGLTLGATAGPAGTGSYMLATGSSTGVVVPDHDAWSITPAGLTVAFLTKTSSADGNIRYPIDKSQAGAFEWRIARASTVTGVWQTRVTDPNNNVQAGEATDGTATSAWQMFVVVIPDAGRATRHKVFMDSATQLTTTQMTLSGTVSAYSNGDGPLNLGKAFTGSLGHVAVFPAALSDAQVGTLFSAAQGEGWIA